MQELVLLHAREEPEVRTTGVGRGEEGASRRQPALRSRGGVPSPRTAACLTTRACACVHVRTKSTHVASVGVLRTCACMRAPMCARAHLQALIPVSSPLDNQPGDSPSLLG